MRKIDSKNAVAIGFIAAIGLPLLMVAAHRTALPIWLPLIIVLGLVFYFLRDKIQSVLLGVGAGTAVILIGLFWWLTVNDMID